MTGNVNFPLDRDCDLGRMPVVAVPEPTMVLRSESHEGDIAWQVPMSACTLGLISLSFAHHKGLELTVSRHRTLNLGKVHPKNIVM